MTDKPTNNPPVSCPAPDPREGLPGRRVGGGTRTVEEDTPDKEEK